MAEVILMLDTTTVVNILVDSLIAIVNDGDINDGVTNDGVILDDGTTLAVVLNTSVDVMVKDGVISLVIILVKTGVTSELERVPVSSVLETTKMLLSVVSVIFILLVIGEEVSMGTVDEIIGELEKGDTVLVKDMMEVISLKLVENPLPSGSDVKSPLPINSDVTGLEDIVTTLLGVNNSVEASTLESIPLPSSSLLSALLSLSLLYCSHILSTE